MATLDSRELLHRLNNQLGVILAHAELIETKAQDAAQKARASQVVSAALQAMADLAPMDQVAALKDGDSGEKFKAAAGQVKILADPADAGVRIKARQHGIAVFHGSRLRKSLQRQGQNPRALS